MECVKRSNEGHHIYFAASQDDGNQGAATGYCAHQQYWSCLHGEKCDIFSRTKNANICTNYVCEYFEDGIVKILFVKFADNTSDFMTKISKMICMTSILTSSSWLNHRDMLVVFW